MKETAKHNQRMAMITFATVYSNATLIKGTICGYKIEEIENPLTKK